MLFLLNGFISVQLKNKTQNVLCLQVMGESSKFVYKTLLTERCVFYCYFTPISLI